MGPWRGGGASTRCRDVLLQVERTQRSTKLSCVPVTGTKQREEDPTRKGTRRSKSPSSRETCRRHEIRVCKKGPVERSIGMPGRGPGHGQMACGEVQGPRGDRGVLGLWGGSLLPPAAYGGSQGSGAGGHVLPACLCQCVLDRFPVRTLATGIRPVVLTYLILANHSHKDPISK